MTVLGALTGAGPTRHGGAGPEPSKTEGKGQPLQSRVAEWMYACFGPKISADKIERNHRFIEEALELVQACGCTASEAHQLVDYVYGRDQGDINQEVGGVMVTLAALCLANGFDMHAAGEIELARVWTKIEKIRAKQAAKPKHSPLPEATTGRAALTQPPPVKRKPAKRSNKARTKWTPGPWRVVIDDDGNPLSGRPSVMASEELDCAIVHWDGFVQDYFRSARGDKEIHANARLIAAAPALYEALAKVVAIADRRTVEFDAARAALALARGAVP